MNTINKKENMTPIIIKQNPNIQTTEKKRIEAKITEKKAEEKNKSSKQSIIKKIKDKKNVDNYSKLLSDPDDGSSSGSSSSTQPQANPPFDAAGGREPDVHGSVLLDWPSYESGSVGVFVRGRDSGRKARRIGGVCRRRWWARATWRRGGRTHFRRRQKSPPGTAPAA